MTFRKTLFFLQEGANTTPNPQAGGPPPVGCSRLLIQYIRCYPLYVEAVSSIPNLKTHHAMVIRGTLNIVHRYTPSQNSQTHTDAYASSEHTSTLLTHGWRPQRHVFTNTILKNFVTFLGISWPFQVHAWMRIWEYTITVFLHIFKKISIFSYHLTINSLVIWRSIVNWSVLNVLSTITCFRFKT
jgi:hypothetical protein